MQIARLKQDLKDEKQRTLELAKRFKADQDVLVQKIATLEQRVQQL